MPLRPTPARETTGLAAEPSRGGALMARLLLLVLAFVPLAGVVFPLAHPTPLEVMPVRAGFAAAVLRPWRAFAAVLPPVAAVFEAAPRAAGRETPVRVTLVPRVAERLRSDDAVLLASLPLRVRLLLLLLLPVSGGRGSLGPPLLAEDALLPRRGVELRLLARLPLPPLLDP